MTWESACAWVQIHTADLPDDQSNPGHRAGLAVEPMTCSPDAFNAESYVFDTDLIVLDPGATSTVSWTIAAI